jgi:hypothetical protein
MHLLNIFIQYIIILIQGPSIPFRSVLITISDLDIFKAHKHIRPFKSVGVDDIPGSVAKGCSHNYVDVLKHIFNLNQSRKYFPTFFKQEESVPVF